MMRSVELGVGPTPVFQIWLNRPIGIV